MMNSTKVDMILKAYQQRINEIVSEYEKKLIEFRVDATLELNALKEDNRILKENVESLESELKMYREQEMEVNNAQ